MKGRIRAFTLLELMLVISIILVLAGLLVAGAQVARQRARAERSRAVVNILATASENYWALCHDYPYPDPDCVGVGSNTLGANPAFRAAYYNSGWGLDAYNIALVWMLSIPRQPAPLINIQEKWYEKIKESAVGPDNRALYKCLDGFGNAIKIDRPRQYYYQNTYMRITSAGADGEFGSGTSDPKAKDNIEIYLKR